MLKSMKPWKAFCWLVLTQLGVGGVCGQATAKSADLPVDTHVQCEDKIDQAIDGQAGSGTQPE